MRTSRRRAVVLVAIGLVVLVVQAGAAAPGLALPRLIEPPFVRQWTQLTGDQTVVLGVRDGLIYYRQGDGVGALDLATGQHRWHIRLADNVRAAVLGEHAIYGISQGETVSELVAVPLANPLTPQQPHTVTRLDTSLNHLEVDFELARDTQRLYVLNQQRARLSAYDPDSGAVLWTCALIPELPRGSWRTSSLDRLETTADGLYVGLDDNGELGVDSKSGKILWHRKAQYAGLYKPLILGGDVIAQYEKLTRRQVRSGRIVWQSGQASDDAVLVGNVVVYSNQRELVGRDAGNGRLLWRLPLRDRNTSYREADKVGPVTDGERAWMLREPVVCVTREGHEEWHLSDPFAGLPVYVDSERIITCDEARILGYAKGSLLPVPATDAQKQALAQHLTAQYELLDDAERHQLIQLVPFAFQPLLARYVEWAKVAAMDPHDDDGQRRYSLLIDTLPLLYATCRREDTTAIVDAWSALPATSDWRARLEQLLQAKGDPAGYVPILVSNLRKLPLSKRQSSAALEAVAHSSHPQAVALMLEALRDPKAAVAWRQEAFRHLAGTGGAEGVEAVRQARFKGGRRAPWYDRIRPGKLDKEQVAGVKQDARGRTWMLFHSAILGNYGDLFIVQKLAAKWGRPLFTGASVGRTFRQPAPKVFRGIPLSQLLATAWMRIFPDDAGLRRDSDHDGLTDLVEARLGTNPMKSDTDGDGLPDAVDPCPNAAPRRLGDTEKIIAACVEARFFGEDWGVPAILEIAQMQPFELDGYAPLVLWQPPRQESPLKKCYGAGVNLLSFHSAAERPRGQSAFIDYSPDHTTAHTVISRYSGGLNGDGIEVTLKKIGDDWFATDLRELYVS